MLFPAVLFLSCEPALHVRPNIIYILADDLGYGDLGCYGQTRIKTPNLDRMAEHGMQFSQHYAGSTVCAPSRCSLMTGLHTGHCSVRGNVDVLMAPDEVTLAKVLRRAGYATACIGKWGIGHPPPPDDPLKNGFEHFFGYLSMWHAHNYYPDFLYRNGEVVKLANVVNHPEQHYKAGQAPLVGLATTKLDYAPDLITKEALDFLTDSQQPFFLFLSYTTPHANNEARDFGVHGMEVPDLGIYADKPWPEAEKAKAAMITRMDRDIGSILKKLVQLGIDDNTLVIFSSDNGPHKEGGVNPDFFDSNGGLRGKKRDLYEGGIRVPMLARWPGQIRAASKSDHVSAFWDVLPTLAEIAGADIPNHIDGISFLPELLGKKQQKHAYLYWEFHQRNTKQAVRFDDFKAVRLAPSAAIRLYNLHQDPGETRDIAARQPETVALAEEMMRAARSREDLWPLKSQSQKHKNHP